MFIEEIRKPRKITTGCCALCQIDQVSNDTPIEFLKDNIGLLTKQMDRNEEVGITTGNGQTATFTIVSPGEHKLEQKLIDLGYTHVWTFSRRRGYPKTGDLKLYILNLDDCKGR